MTEERIFKIHIQNQPSESLKMLIFTSFCVETFFRGLGKIFSLVVQQWWGYLEGEFILEVYVSKNIRVIRHTNRNIIKETWQKSEFLRSTFKINLLRAWKCSFLPLFVLKLFFEGLEKIFIGRTTMMRVCRRCFYPRSLRH